MSIPSINDKIDSYKKALASGELQQTYQSLVGVVQSLRAEFNKKYKGSFTVANVLHGYIDFTYFYLQNDFLKKHKLKLAIVLNHQKAHFELWLLGQTKDVQVSYWKKLKDVKWVNEDLMPEWSIFEIVMLINPNFDNKELLSDSIHSAFIALSEDIFETLKAYD